MRRKPRGEAKIVKGMKDYKCIICEKDLPKGTKHVSFSHSSPYLRKAWKKLTKFYPSVKVVETFISLRFCSGRCYRFWIRAYQNEYKDYAPIWQRIHKKEVEVLKRRSAGWKQWKLWKEVLDPLHGRRVSEDESKKSS